MMQHRLKISTKTVIIAVLISTSTSLVALAEERHEDRGIEIQQAYDAPREFRPEHRGLLLGICVGEALSQQGISMPPLETVESLASLDSSTQAAIQSALDTCQSPPSGVNPIASPVPSPVIVPPPTPSPSPSPSPSPTDSTQPSISP